jgi:hypothetical protein
MDPFALEPAKKTPESVIPELDGRTATADEQMLVDGMELPLTSSNVASMQWRWGEFNASGDPIYDPRLFVSFLGGGRYQYTGVSLATALEMMHAPSPGRFVWQRLRDQYPTERL